MSSSSPARVIRFEDLAPAAWRNRGGTTREIVSAPSRDSQSDFAWRLSLAEVSQDGAFSTFDGVDRVLVLCSGAGLVLDVDGELVTLEPFDVARFRGESRTSARLVEGRTTDLNVMTTRAEARAEVTVTTLIGETHLACTSSDTCVAVVVQGDLTLGEPGVTGGLHGRPLAPFDAVRVDAHDRVSMVGRGVFVRIDLSMRR